MPNLLHTLRHSLTSKLIVAVGLTLLFGIFTWAYFNIRYTRAKVMNNIVEGADRLGNTIKLGAHYAMMLNSRDDINQIIKNIGRQKEIEIIRIYNKDGVIKYSYDPSEVDKTTNIKDEACIICHLTEPPLEAVALDKRIRIFKSKQGYRLLGVISPIMNEPGCSSDCHFHPEEKKVLGALDMVVSLAETDNEIRSFEKGLVWLAGFVFLVTATLIFIMVFRFVKIPIQKLIDGTRHIARGEYQTEVHIKQKDELGRLAAAINQMSGEIAKNQDEIKRQKDEYQELFELVPCLITVVDRDYKLVKYNREYADRFNAEPGDFCFKAWKGLSEKCPVCPVEKTFEDGVVHHSEESGVNRDGTTAHWIVITSPVTNEKGETISAMEICLDITERKQLEEWLVRSEKKYHDIFSNIPNPVFVLDFETLQVLDVNGSVTQLYGYEKDELADRSFLNLFANPDEDDYDRLMKTTSFINQVRQMKKDGSVMFVNIRISPSDHIGRRVLLVTTSDITQRLEAEQQLAQAAKLATLGEMATGVAHELNQPLSVIKTASSFIMKKIKKNEEVDRSVLNTMLEKVDGNVDRADKIIRHMRQFARKSDVKLVLTQVNAIIEKSFEIFSQQLKVRGIDVVWNLQADLPQIMADPDRLEQVFINLLINARDAIEEAFEKRGVKDVEKVIYITTNSGREKVLVEICDTGNGIPDSVKDKVFDPFFTTKEVGKGTGLGLAISYGIVKDCGGTIRIGPEKHLGACFIIEFPTAES